MSNRLQHPQNTGSAWVEHPPRPASFKSPSPMPAWFVGASARGLSAPADDEDDASAQFVSAGQPLGEAPAGCAAVVHLVDDGAADLQAAIGALRAAGYEVETHASARALLRRIDETTPCCLLLGMEMSDMTGLEAQAELNRRGLPWPVIMTGRSEIDGVIQAMKSGALDFLERPLDGAVLLKVAEAGLQKVEQVRTHKARVARACASIDRLTARERQVMVGLLAGLPNKVIAHQMEISVRTVEIYRATVMNKLHARSLSSIVRLALDAGLESLVGDWAAS